MQLTEDVRAFLENLAESGSEPLNSAVAYKSREDRAYFSTEIRSRARELLAAHNAGAQEPVDMLLFCPKCAAQHIDAPEDHEIDKGSHIDVMRDWTNPPHRSHLCHSCGTIWRPADVPTNGVAKIETRGKADTWDATAQPQPMTDNDWPEVMSAVQDAEGRVTSATLQVGEVTTRMVPTSESRPDEARDSQPSQAALSDAARDAARYQWIRHRTSAHGVIDGYVFSFPLRFPAPANAMRGSVAQHLDEAIDAEIERGEREGKA